MYNLFLFILSKSGPKHTTAVYLQKMPSHLLLTHFVFYLFCSYNSVLLLRMCRRKRDSVMWGNWLWTFVLHRLPRSACRTWRKSKGEFITGYIPYLKRQRIERLVTVDWQSLNKEKAIEDIASQPCPLTWPQCPNFKALPVSYALKHWSAPEMFQS